MNTETTTSSVYGGPVYLRAPDVRHVTGVRAQDMELIKSLARIVLPDIKPGQRLEYLARAYGFKSAIAMRAAIMQATDEDSFLKPCSGPLDEFRSAILDKTLAGPARSQATCDRLMDCAPLINAGLEMSRGTWDGIALPFPDGTPHTPPSLPDLYKHLKASCTGLETRSNGFWGNIRLDTCLPDLRWMNPGNERFTQGGVFTSRHMIDQGEDYVEIVSVAGGSPSRSEIMAMGAKWTDGDIRQEVFATAEGYLEEAEYDEHRIAFTLLSRKADGKIMAYITVVMTLDHESDEDEEMILEELFKDADDELSQENLDYFQLTNWSLTITFNDYGILGEGDEMDCLEIFNRALFAYYWTLFREIGEAANKTGNAVTIRVFPDDGDYFGLIACDQMIDRIEEVIHNFTTGEFYADEAGKDSFTFELTGY